MIDILAFVNDQLAQSGIPYEYGEWMSEIRYPYFVGEYRADSYSYETGCTAGTLTLNGWSRLSFDELAEANETIKALFANKQAVVDNNAFFVCYGGADALPSGEEGLYRIRITLDTMEWKGE